MQDDEIFITIRQQIHEFIADNFSEHELKQVSSITRDIEPKLKYCVIDRYAGTYISGRSITRLSKKVNQFRHTDLFFAFGYKVLKQHHEEMKHDPERLTTEFMQKILNISCDIEL